MSARDLLFDLAADAAREHAKAISPQARAYYSNHIDEVPEGSGVARSTTPRAGGGLIPTSSQPMAMLPNDKHPGPACSCRECLSAYPSRDLDAELDDAQRKKWREEARELADCYAPYEKGNEP